MRLKILLPSRTLVDRDVSKVVADAPNGSFCLLPRHADFASAIAPGILSFSVEAQGEEMTGEEKESAAAEVFVAVDEGVLVKQGQTVLVSTINAVTGKELGRLEEAVMRDFRQRSEHERKALQAINRIEAGFVRRFLDIRRME